MPTAPRTHVRGGPVILTALALTVLVAPSLGCSKGRSSRPAVATTTATTSGSGAPAAGTTTPGAGIPPPGSGGTTTTPGSGGTTGTTPGSGGTTTNPRSPGTPVTDRDGPAITITSPQRGEFITGTSTTITGTVTDPSGVSLLEVNGVLRSFDPATGAFSVSATLPGGMAVIVARAVDTLGNDSIRSVAVLAGEFRPENELVREAAAARINQPTFDVIESLIASQISGADLSALIAGLNPLAREQVTLFGRCIASAEVTTTGSSFGNPVVDLDPTAAGLDTTVTIPNMRIDVRARSFCGIPYSLSGNVTADSVDVSTTLDVTVNSSNGLDVTVANTSVALQNFRFDIRGIPGVIESLLRSTVRSRLERMLKDYIDNNLPQQANNALSTLTSSATFNVNGVTLTADFVPNTIDFDDDGATLVIDANLTAPTTPGTFAAPGSYKTPSQLPAMPSTPGFRVTMSDDMINRASYAAWRAGLLDVSVSGSQIPNVGPVGLDSTTLALFFPQLIGAIPPGQPIEIALTPLLPPLMKVTGTPDLVKLNLGDMQLDMFVDDGQGNRIHIMQVALHLRVDATAVVNGNMLSVAINQRPLFLADLVLEPVANLDDRAVENFLAFIVPPAIQLGASLWSGAPIPTFGPVSVTNLQIQQDGPAGDFLTVSGDVR